MDMFHVCVADMLSYDRQRCPNSRSCSQLPAPRSGELGTKRARRHDGFSPTYWSTNADASSLVVCVDIYDREAKDGMDKFLCRGSVPFREAWEESRHGEHGDWLLADAGWGSKGFSTPKTVDLTPSNEGKLQLSFMSSANKDQGSALNLGLLDCQRAKCRQVARARTHGNGQRVLLPPQATNNYTAREPTNQHVITFLTCLTWIYLALCGEAEKIVNHLTELVGFCLRYCIVRLADLGQLGDPTDQASASLPSAASMPGDFLDTSRSLLVQQEDVLDLPGACQDGLVAVRNSEIERLSSQPERLSHTARNGARSVMESFYSAVNGRDLETALNMVDDDVLYEDFTFQEPFRGREGVRELLSDAMSLPKGLDFIIDDVAGGDSWSGDDAVGMTWHVEFDGVPLPNSRGASLYKTKNGKLSYARDIVESPLKLGSAALGIVGFIATLVRRSSKQGLAGSFVAFATAASLYWYVLLLSPQGQFPFLGGPPAWAIDDTTLRNVIDESLNFFYIWPGLDSIGLPSPSTLGIALPEALFNLADAWFNACTLSHPGAVGSVRVDALLAEEAYAFMLLPLLLWDRPQRNVYNWWAPAMFLTNAILLPYFATRALAPGPKERQKPSWSPLFGILALLVVAVAIWQSWGLYAGLPSLLLGDRVAFAFAVDATLFALLQAYVFAETSGPAWRFVPFFGLAAWLILPEEQDEVRTEPLPA
eukprot:s246_g21.t1